MKYFFFVLFTFTCTRATCQSAIDVQHYKFYLDLDDKTNEIKGVAEISIKFLETLDSFALDLTAPGKDGIGMRVKTVGVTTGIRDFTQKDEKLLIRLKEQATTNTILTFRIEYSGIPADGLIISRNKFGNRTFFSDNWPNRAHHWIPCNDRPDDKASVDFYVAVPGSYQVVSNGLLQLDSVKSEWTEAANAKRRYYHWKEDVPLPTKVMVIGVAGFAVDTAGIVNGIPVTSWVFPENKKEGFYDYAQAKDILSWFIDYIGPFPYKKLANVQSKTIFGGMENAGAIFYYENSVTGKRSEERLLAHEIAHQWFGDMATEKNFSHLWLSEGFATYLASMYLKSKHGSERFVEEMKEDRLQVIDFARTSEQPVVDTVSPYMKLLNANSYQKGGWILHMLRRELGDSIFHAIIRNYYTAFAGKNAGTRDFQHICEETSGKNLESFFRQWLYTPGIPKLDIKWRYDAKKKKVLFTIQQLQSTPFEFSLEIEIETAAGKKKQRFIISKQVQQFSLPAKTKPARVIADPNTSLLFEASVSKAG